MKLIRWIQKINLKIIQMKNINLSATGLDTYFQCLDIAWETLILCPQSSLARKKILFFGSCGLSLYLSTVSSSWIS